MATTTTSRETAFYPRIAAMTDDWMDLFGYLAPSVVSTTAEEYQACRRTAALMDFSMLRKVDIDGPGAVDLVNSAVTRDITRLPQGRIAYGAMTDERGKMIDDCTCMIRSPSSVRFCGANDRDLGVFTAKAAGSQITVTHQTDALPHLCLQGPESRRILERLTQSDLSGEVFPYYTFREDVEIAGIPVFMTRLGYTAELGYELWVERARCLELWDALIEAGASAGMRVIGMDALDLFRIEGGFIIGGVEYDPTVSPYECGLGWSVDLDKADLPARAALTADRDATTLRLTSVVLESGGTEASGATLEVDGQAVGTVTQAVVSPYLDGKTLGLAKIEKPSAEPGTQVVARVAGQTVAGEVVRHPVYDPDRQRAKHG
ncbi:MAG: aminomethyl transferase family protein [Chloroflexi bacterium]|nr:MAG: aminomethyl transferase family protein [Chloroflexota bacterium]